jgi:hypothetical protein
LAADLERLFDGHAIASNELWFVQIIKSNLAGATAIAEHWYERLAPSSWVVTSARSCESVATAGG